MSLLPIIDSNSNSNSNSNSSSNSSNSSNNSSSNNNTCSCSHNHISINEAGAYSSSSSFPASASSFPFTFQDIVNYINNYISNLLPKLPREFPLPIEARTVTLSSKGIVNVYFEKPFMKTPTVVGVFHNYKVNIPQLRLQPFSIQLPRVSLPRITIPGLSTMSLPRVPTFTPPIDRVKPWGDIWYDSFTSAVGNYPVLSMIADALGRVLRFIGNQFFFIYYSSTGDYTVIANAIATPVIQTMTDAFNNYISNTLNNKILEIENRIKAMMSVAEASLIDNIRNTETLLNNTIATIEQDIQNTANTVIDNLMNAYGFAKDIFGKYPLLVPFSPIVVTQYYFTIENPQNNTLISYIAVSPP